MVLDGRKIIEKNIVTFPDDLMDNESSIQPNGVDLRVHRVFYVSGKVKLPRDKRIELDGKAQEIQYKDGYFNLTNFTGNYLIDFREDCDMKDGYCGIIIPRSSLVRCGIQVLSGLWDTGFGGRLGCSARIRNPIDIEYGAAIAQLVVYKAEFNGQVYRGTYQRKDSQAIFQ